MPQINIPKNRFLNNSELSDEEAKSLVGRLSKMVEKSETAFETYRNKAERSLAIIRNELWTKEDIEFFEELDITPYSIPEARAPFNRLFGQQRTSKYDFDIIPDDIHAFERHRKNRDEFVEKHGHEFNSLREAQDYFDRYADDNFAESVTVYLDKFRNRTNAKHNEAQIFENGVITGCDLFKSVYSTRNNPDGQLERERRSIRQMFWDSNSVDYFLSDVEFIGEVNRFYVHDLVSLFPHFAKEIEEKFEDYTNFTRHNYVHNQHNIDWRNFYHYDSANDEPQLKVVEIWHKQLEDRFQLIDMQENESRLVQPGFTEDEIYDKLLVQVVEELEQEVMEGQRDPSFFARSQSEVNADVQAIVEQRYEVHPVRVPAFYKTVFSYNALLEHTRSPLPHDSHPYTPFFPQFTDGWWTSVVDDTKDIILALNKAVMFRELIQAHSAKGVLVVDKKTVHRSNMTIDSIREQWTEIGAVIDLDLSGGRRLQDVFQHINTMHDGLAEISAVIAELKQRLYEIIGVNDAMMGSVGNEASASQVRQRIVQGSTTNGILYDNFNASLEYHVKHKEIPLIAHEMFVKRPKAMRKLGDSRGEWIEWVYDEEFELFVDSMRRGDFTFRLKPKDSNEQFDQQQTAMLLQLAMSSPEIDIEAALEFSNMPFAHRFIRRNKELIRSKQNQMMQNQIDISSVAQMAMELGVDVETADELQRKMRLERAKQLQAEEGQQIQQAQGMSAIQSGASEAQRQERIFESTLE